jgi:DNA-binding GntR family transcriptional regulator
MIALIAVFRIELNISSLTACNEFWMISSVTGSNCVVVTAEHPDPLASSSAAKRQRRHVTRSMLHSRVPSSGPTLARLDRTNLRDQARRALRTSIITGELTPGELYTVGAFAERLGVSATPVREALGDLAQLGLVETIRNRGFVVRHLTDHDLDEIFQLRLLLEAPAVEQVAGRLPPDDLAVCRQLVERCKTAAAAADLELFLETDREFHLRLLGVLGNLRLVRILGELRDQTRLYGLRELAASGRLVAAAEEHESLLEAVEAGDGKSARQEMTKHLRHIRGAWAGKIKSSA